MKRTVLKPLLVAVAGAALWAGTAAAAKAQFRPGMRPGFVYNSPFGSYGFNYNTRSSFNYSWVNPFTRQPYSVQFSSFSSGPPPGMFGPRYGAVPTYSPPVYYPRTYSSSSSMANPVVRDQLRFFAGGPQAPAPAPRNAARPPANAVAAKPQPGAEKKGNPVAVDPKLVSPTDEAVASGEALNALAAAIRDLEAKGARAPSPLLPAELLSQVTFAGVPGAEAIAILKDGKPELPGLLRRNEYLVEKDAVEGPLGTVADLLANGKPVPANDADRLAAGLKKAKDRLTPVLKDVAVPDAAVVTAFFDKVDALVRTAKDPAMDGVVVPKWFSVGGSVSEVAQHLGKYKLVFGPSKGRDDVYRTLQRGLVTYYTALAANGVK